MANRRVTKRIIYKVDVSLASPLCISASDAESTETDSDVLLDYDGRAFIPGSSIAGACREYSEKNRSLFGFSEENTGRMSSVFFSDMMIDEKQLEIRDSVCLTDGKLSTAGAKFDMQVVDTGACGSFYAELVLREGDPPDLENALEACLVGIKNHEICFGSKKTRGYGKLDVRRIGKRIFEGNNILNYPRAYDEDFDYGRDIKDDLKKPDAKYITINVPLRMRGGISIRKYAAKKGEPDFATMTANGKPVIPGTSVAGAIRHRVKDILNEFCPEKTDEVIKGMFGFVKGEKKLNKDERQAAMSSVVFEEAVIDGARPLTTVRNAVSRFEAATKDGALYKERTYVDGKTNITIKVKKGKNGEEKSWVGLLLLALKDLQSGYLAIGGQTSVGRGIFEADGDIGIDNDNDTSKFEFNIREVNHV